VDPRLLIHPGEILKEEFLVPFGLSANRLAKAIGVPANRITEIINGTRGITGATAVLLGHAFGTTPEFWLNLQSRYELDVASALVPREAIQRADAFNRELRAA
jgi:antitoxin HigA-1